MRFRVRLQPIEQVSPERTSDIQLTPVSLPGEFRGRYRVRQAPTPPSTQPVAFCGRYRLRRPAALVVPPGPPPRRRGRAPSYLADPWSDLEWENHPEAQIAVAEHPGGMTLEEIGECMNITRERVRQIEHQALAKLRLNGGDDVTWIGKLTIAIPECDRCGTAFVRKTGRQVLCDACEAQKKRKRPPEHYLKSPSSFKVSSLAAVASACP